MGYKSQVKADSTSMSVSPARDRILGTAELFTIIISYLSDIDLLILRRVSKQWFEIIEDQWRKTHEALLPKRSKLAEEILTCRPNPVWRSVPSIRQMWHHDNRMKSNDGGHIFKCQFAHRTRPQHFAEEAKYASWRKFFSQSHQ